MTEQLRGFGLFISDFFPVTYSGFGSADTCNLSRYYPIFVLKSVQQFIMAEQKVISLTVISVDTQVLINM